MQVENGAYIIRCIDSENLEVVQRKWINTVEENGFKKSEQYNVTFINLYNLVIIFLLLSGNWYIKNNKYYIYSQCKSVEKK